MIRRIIARIIINAAALFTTAYFIPGIHFEGGIEALLLAGIILGFLNTFVKPILTILSCPLILLTLGLFYIIINTIILYLLAFLMPDYAIYSPISALLGSILISFLNWILSWLFAINEKKEKRPEKNDN
ncbi:MAG: hypothetical protein A2Y62_10875 [Candidatus Fischerbacteria bacterium RBG_13_37_8]|uniref:Phage holin family protein n=1 Tax=Candidatus Fischerbacteria bacterium RBG_13_37_8 TaxID=1817863 RepID=A0A1F5VUH0_9BACT|nr:MAG: hypothetical protein A2Y62_10875 [Candidatus Fischerbacteria bacterium RBG_13_37_8]